MWRSSCLLPGLRTAIPTIELPDGSIKRVDEMEKCNHYKCWREDFELVRELGAEYLRYGPPYYKTHLGPGKYDWEFSDQTFRKLRELGIKPIADLCHFGVPDWIGNFQNKEWPRFFAEYAKRFRTALSVDSLHHTDQRNLHRRDVFRPVRLVERAPDRRPPFVTALHNLCKANVLAMHSILDVNPKAIFVLSEASEFNHPRNPACAGTAYIYNQKRFLVART